MNSKSKLTISIILAMVLAATAVIAIIVVWAARQQEFSSFIEVKYKAEEVSGQASARWKVANENTWHNMTAGGETNGATVLTFGEKTNESSSLSPTDKNIKLTSQNNYAVFEYKFTNTGSNDYAIDLFYTDDETKDVNMSVFCINSDDEISTDFEETINISYDDWTTTKISGNGGTKYVYILASIINVSLDAGYSGSFQFNLDGKDYSNDIEIDGTGTITGLKTDNLSVVRIPDKINGTPVTKISAGTFADNATITELTIPDTVEEIEQGALNSGCGRLKYISIPFVGNTKSANSSSNTHFGYIFGASSYSSQDEIIPTSLTHVVITGGTSIGKNAFCECKNLKNITLPSSLTLIGDTAFQECTGLTGSLTFPEGVMHIGGLAFENCSGLTSIILPSGLTDFDGSEFEGCSGLTSIKVNSENKRYTSRNSNGIECNCVIDLNNNKLMLGCFTSSIPNDGSVTSIGNFVFFNCSKLTSIIIPSSVTGIGRYPFYNCSQLTEVTIESEYVYPEATSKTACGSLLGYATTVKVLSSLVKSGHAYINETNFPNVSTESINGKDYTVYRK